MAETYKKLYQGQPGTSAATIYTAPASTAAIVKSIRIVNTTASAATIKLFQSGTADTNVILPATSIDAGGFAEFDGTLTLAAADTLAAQAGTATAITVTVYGVEVT